MREYRHWTQREVDFLIKSYPTKSALQIAFALDRSLEQVQGMMNRLRKKQALPKKCSKWSEKELQYFKENLGKKSYKQMALELGRSYTTTKSAITFFRNKGVL